MAHKIDHMALWVFSALSAFLLIFALSDGNILISILLAFVLTSILNISILRLIPEKKWLSRKKRLQRIDRLLYEWALMDTMCLKRTMAQLFPDLTDKLYSENSVVLQRMPQGEALSANELLSLRQIIQNRLPLPDKVYLFTTCTLSEEAKDILPLASAPQIEAVDKSALSARLLAIFDELPTEDSRHTKREQRGCLRSRIALCIRNIRPLRIGMYLCFFAGMYLITESKLYLFSCAMYAVLILAHCLFRDS